MQKNYLSRQADAAYPWSDAPVETIEAIVEVVQLPDEP